MTTGCPVMRIFFVKMWAQGNPVFITRNGFVISEKFGSDKMKMSLVWVLYYRLGMLGTFRVKH